MKRFLQVMVVAVVAVVTLSSCNFDNFTDILGGLTSKGTYSLNKVKNTTLTYKLPNGVSTDAIEFSCDSDWTLTTDASWIQFDMGLTTGEANKLYPLIISCSYILSEEEQDTQLPRTGHIYLDCDAFDEPKLIITVTQTKD
ncbi:MAG: BACON domain-containing protein [Rikenellaceae bacterium]|nr:BACON domain-containing protein [Rikenellaceae bacterium]